MDIDATIDDLIRWEGLIPHMYLDTKGYVTVAIGHLLRDMNAALELPFVVGDRPAGPFEITAAFNAVAKMPPALPAGRYAVASAVRLPETGCRELAGKRLQGEFLPGLEHLFPGFDGLPGPAQRALVDMAWNVGLTGLGLFSHVRSAIAQRDWSTAALACHRRGVREERNAWAADLFLEAAGGT